MAYLKKIFKNINILFIVIITSFVPLIVWPCGADYFYYPKILIIYLLLIIASAAAIVSYRKSHTHFKYSAELVPLAVFFAFIILSALFSPFKDRVLWGRNLRWEGLFTYISYFLIYYLSFNYVKGSEDMKKIIFPLIISSMVISIYGVLQYIGVDPIPRDSIRASWKMVSFSTLGNPNFLGSYLSIMFPISLTLYLLNCEKRHLILLFIWSLLTYTALICTQARSAWVGTAFSIIMLFIFFFKPIVKNIKKLLPLLVCMVLITYGLNALHGGTIKAKVESLADDYKKVTGESGSGRSTAGSQRIFIWSRTLEYVFDRPILGYGPDTLDKVFWMSPKEALFHFGSQSIFVDKAHNEYLQITVTLGFPAVISYLAFLFVLVFKSLKSILKGCYTKYTVCLLCGASAYMVQAFFNISVVSVSPVYWCIIGMLTAVNYMNEKGQTRSVLY